MKFLTVFVVLCLVAYSTQDILFEGNCNEYQKALNDPKSCMIVKCSNSKSGNSMSSSMSSNGCGFVRCEEGQQMMGNSPGDAAAVYPGCCSKPICQ